MAELKKRQAVEVLAHWLETLANEGRGLTDWEKQRIEDWQAQIDEGHGLTERQEEVLENLYVHKTA